MILDRNICQKNNFTQFSKKSLLKSFFILEILIFSELGPKNPDPLKIKNKLKKTENHNSEPVQL